MKPYSLDLRQKIIETYEENNLSQRELAKRSQGVTKGFKGNQDKDSSQMNPKEIEWLRQPPKISICYHHSIRPVYKPA
jgi:hypothetical protein